MSLHTRQAPNDRLAMLPKCNISRLQTLPQNSAERIDSRQISHECHVPRNLVLHVVDASFPEGSGLVLLEPETDAESDGRTHAHAAWEHALLRHWRGAATLDPASEYGVSACRVL